VRALRRGDLIYFYNLATENHPAFRVKVTAPVRTELVEIPLANFPGCQADYDDLRVYQSATEIARVIAGGKLKFLANNAAQGETNPYPGYTVYYGNPALGAPVYDPTELAAINAAVLSGNANYILDRRFAYTDDFSNAATLANYTITDLGPVEGPSNWNIASGYLNQTSNIYGPTTSGTQFPYERGTQLILKNGFSGDWSLSVKMKAGDNDGIGLIFGYQNSQNFYALEWDQQISKLGFWKSVNQTDTGTVIAQVTSYPYSQGVWYNLRIEKRGATYQVYVNDVLKMTASDSAFTTGRVGLLSRGSINLQYDDFAIIPVNAAYTDDFSTSSTITNYNITDIGLIEAPSNWNIANGYLNQLSNINGPTTKGTQYPYERGTHLILKGIYTGNWDLSVKTKAGDNDGIGLIFGYQNSQSFYALEWDQQTSKLGFWKSVNQTDTGTVIAQVTSYPYTQGVWYTLKIEKRGTTYQVYVNGTLKITGSDPAFGSGRVGLLSRGSINLQMMIWRLFRCHKNWGSGWFVLGPFSLVGTMVHGSGGGGCLWWS
jgi:hypothetical protein